MFREIFFRVVNMLISWCFYKAPHNSSMSAPPSTASSLSLALKEDQFHLQLVISWLLQGTAACITSVIAVTIHILSSYADVMILMQSTTNLIINVGQSLRDSNAYQCLRRYLEVFISKVFGNQGGWKPSRILISYDIYKADTQHKPVNYLRGTTGLSHVNRWQHFRIILDVSIYTRFCLQVRPD